MRPYDDGSGSQPMTRFQRRRMLARTPGAGFGVNMGRVGRPPEAAPFNPAGPDPAALSPQFGAADGMPTRPTRPPMGPMLGAISGMQGAINPAKLKLPMPSLPPWMGGGGMGAFDRSTQPVGPDGPPVALPTDENAMSRANDVQKLPMPAFPGLGTRPMLPWDRRGGAY